MNVAFVTAADDWKNDKELLEFSRKVNATIRSLEQSNVTVRSVQALTGWDKPTVMLGYDTPEDVDEKMIAATKITNDITKNVLSQFGIGEK